METSTQTPTPAQAPAPASEAATPQQTSHAGTDPASSVTPSKTSSDMYDVVVNGKTHQMTLDQMRSAASMSYAAQQRFEEASKMRKDYETFKSSAQKDLIQALRAEGFNNEQIREQMERWYTETYIEPETLTPEQRKLKEYESQLKKYQEQEAQKLAEQQKQQEEELTSKQREYLTGQIVTALEKSGLPKTKFIASRMAFYMRENLLQGWEAPMDVIVQQVKQERQALMSGEVGGLEGEALIQYLGEDIVDKIRKHDLMQLRSRRQNMSNNFQTSGQSQQNHSEKIDSSEVRRRLRELTSGKR